MIEPIIPPVDSYLGIVAAFRARKDQLGLTCETIDELAGFAARYTNKTLAEEPLRHMGVMAFDAMLGVLALKIAVIPDPEKLEKIKKHRHFVRRKTSKQADATQAYIAHRVTLPFLRAIGSKGGHARREKLSDRRREQIARNAARARAAKLSPEERSAGASKAAKARWRKPRVVEVKAGR